MYLIMDRLLDKDELAERLHLPPKTLNFWRHKGIGPKGVRIGKRVLYRESAVEAWLDSQFAEIDERQKAAGA
jgi:predicted DNA-binding transcriptional regulator AlpA